MSRFELMIRLVVVGLTLFASLPIVRVSANPDDYPSYQTEKLIPVAVTAAITTISDLTNPSLPALTATAPISATEAITPNKTVFLPLIIQSLPNPPGYAPSARLFISKTAPATAAIGSPITYTLTITNIGNAPATNLVITDAIPVGASYVRGGSAVVDNTVSWTLPSLAGGAAAQASFAVTATRTITNSNYGVAASSGISATGTISVVTVIQEVPEAILVIGKTAPISVAAGEPITYTLAVTNSGTLTATHLMISDTLPAGAVYVQGGVRMGDIVSWTVDSLPPDSSMSVALIITATETITNRDYRVSGDGGITAVGQEAVVTIVYPLVSADFAANPLAGTAPLTVTFANSSTNALMYLWDFGDAITNTEVSPTHTYTQAGVYSVTLTSVGLSGSQTLFRPNYLTVYEPVLSDFIAAPSTGQAPLTVTFTNHSTGASDYFWDFGDGITATAISPTHTYTQVGVYTVTLTATSANSSDVVTRTNCLTVSEPLTADFTAAPLTGTVPLTVTFITSSTHATRLLWNFGDGIVLTSTGTMTTSMISLTHTYTQAGVYTVSLTASDGSLTEVLTRTNFITVNAPIIRDWRVMTTPVSPPVIGEHSLAYDSARSRVILYGGNAAGWPYKEETWEFDGSGWFTIATSTHPVARYGAGLTYNPVEQVTVLFGGSNELDTALNQTWEYTNTNWTQISMTGPVPAGRTYAGMVTNPGSGITYLFGGNNHDTCFNDLWQYENHTWTEIMGGDTKPVSRTLAALAFDTEHDRLLLFGGRSITGTLLADLWAFDLVAKTWQELDAGGQSGPSPRMAHSLVYDPVTHDFVLIGGVAGHGDIRLDDTWHYREDGGWIQITSPVISPAPAYQQAVYGDNAIVLFSNGEIWRYE